MPDPRTGAARRRRSRSRSSASTIRTSPATPAPSCSASGSRSRRSSRTRPTIPSPRATTCTRCPTRSSSTRTASCATACSARRARTTSKPPSTTLLAATATIRRRSGRRGVLLLPAEVAGGERAARATAHATSTASSPVGERLRRRAPSAPSPRARPRAAPWRSPASRVGSLASGYAIPPRKSSTRNSPFAAARFASARSVPAMSMPIPANATVPSSSSPTAGDDPRRHVPADRDTDRDDEQRSAGSRARARSRSWRRAGRRATAASSRAASARRSAVRSRSRCRATPSPPPSPRARARRARGSRRAARSRSRSLSTLAKNTRMPSGIASVTIRFSPRRSCSIVSARACATSARRLHGYRASSAVICRKTSSSERRPACSAASVTFASRRKHARSAMRSGVPARAHDVLARALLDDVAVGRGRARCASASTSSPASAANQISSRDRVPGELGRRTERGELAAGDDRDAVAELLGFVHRVRREQDGHAAVAQVAHELPRRGAGVRVHARRRLVEEHDLGPADRARTRARGVAPGRPRAGAPSVPAASRRPTRSSSASGDSASS